MLDEFGIIHWVDGGSLLGLVREGRLLSHDTDIDLSTTDEFRPQVERFAAHLRSSGWIVAGRYYRGRLYKLKAWKTDGSGERAIDIAIFRRVDRHYWMPSVKLRPGLEVPSTPGRKRALLAQRRLLTKLVGKTWAPRRPYSRFWRQFYGFAVWWIPEEFFQSFDVIEGTRIRIPSDAEGYLRHRYGDWKTPTRNWLFYRDDPFFKLDPIGEQLPVE